MCSNFRSVSQPKGRAVDNLVDGFNGKKMGIRGEISKLLVENIDVAPEYMTFMQRYKEWWDTKKKLMGASWQRDMVTNKEDKRESLMKLVGQEFVIIDDFGWPRNPDGYNKLVKRVAQKAGISDIHPHMFRHTFVSLLMSNPDIGVATVAAEAGHAQPSTTLMIYTQQYKKRRESIRNQLSRELYEK